MERGLLIRALRTKVAARHATDLALSPMTGKIPKRYGMYIPSVTSGGIDQASSTRLPNFHPPSVHSASNRAWRSPRGNWAMTRALCDRRRLDGAAGGTGGVRQQRERSDLSRRSLRRLAGTRARSLSSRLPLRAGQALRLRPFVPIRPHAGKARTRCVAVRDRCCLI